MFKVGLLGNCQVSGIAACIAKMTPELPLTIVDLAKVRGAEARDRAADELRQCDIILAQERQGMGFGRLSTETLPAERTIFFPAIAFIGFHPDMFTPQQRIADLGGMAHSAILTASFLLNLPVERALGLYNAYFFRRLGYMIADGSKRALVARFAKHGLDVAPLLDDWLRAGAFMYTSNHPKIRVLRSVAELLLKRIDVDFDPAAEMPADGLAKEVSWPIHPEIASQAGVDPEPRIKLPTGEVVDLEQFARRSYAFYEKVSVDELRLPPVNLVESVLAAEIK